MHNECSIVEKLRELGWGDELDRIADADYSPLCDHAQVKMPKPLTDRGEYACATLIRTLGVLTHKLRPWQCG